MAHHPPVTVTLTNDEQAIIGYGLLMAYDPQYSRKVSLDTMMDVSILFNKYGWNNFISLVGRITGYDRAEETAERQ